MLVLDVVDGPPGDDGDDIFCLHPTTTLFFLAMRGNRGKNGEGQKGCFPEKFWVPGDELRIPGYTW